MKYFLVILFFTQSSLALNLSEVWNQSSYGEFVNNDIKDVYLNVGMGSYQNSIQMSEDRNLYTTNNSFYVLSAKLNKAKLQVNIPRNSDGDTRRLQGDSKYRVYALSYDIDSHFTLELDYYAVDGFYYQSKDNSTNDLYYKLPEFKNRQLNLVGFYTFNKDHTSFITEPLVFDKRNDSSSWMLITKLRNIEMNGMNTLSQVPELSTIDDYNSAKIYTGELTLAYSKNAFWDHWFLGGAYGMGANISSISTEYKDGQKSSKSKFGTTTLLSISTGYIWTKAKLAFFANQNRSLVYLDDISIGNSGGSIGFYYGYQF